jgi:hypothetical protein
MQCHGCWSSLASLGLPCVRAVRLGTFARGRRGRLGLSRLSASRGGWRLKAGPLSARGPAGSGRAPPRARFPRASWRCGRFAARSPRPGGGRLLGVGLLSCWRWPWGGRRCPWAVLPLCGGSLGGGFVGGWGGSPPCGCLLVAPLLVPPHPSWWVVLAPPLSCVAPPFRGVSWWSAAVAGRLVTRPSGGCRLSPRCHPPVGRPPPLPWCWACAAAALLAGGNGAPRASRPLCVRILLMNGLQLVFSTWFVICPRVLHYALWASGQ